MNWRAASAFIASMGLIALFVAMLWGLMDFLMPLVGVGWAFAITGSVAVCVGALAAGYAER